MLINACGKRGFWSPRKSLGNWKEFCGHWKFVTETSTLGLEMKIYCEHGALTGDLRALQRDGRIELVHFPYDPGSRTRNIAPSATVSDAQWRDLNTTWDELAGTWDDFAGSVHLPEIIRIIGPGNRRDALHIDSAYKTGCAAFVTADSDILDHKGELEALLGRRFFDPDRDNEELRRFIADRCGSA